MDMLKYLCWMGALVLLCAAVCMAPFAICGLRAVWLKLRKVAYRFGLISRLKTSTLAIMSFLEHVDHRQTTEEEEEEELDEVLAGAPAPGGDLPAIPVTPRRRKTDLVDQFGLPKFWYDLARRAKLKWGALPMDAFNQNAVQRYLLRELEGKKGVRTSDIVRYMPRMVLYVFYRTERERELEEAMEELDMLGLIRRQAV